MEASIDPSKHAVGGIGPFGVALSGLHPGKDFDAFLDPGDGQDLELPGSHRADHVVPQHQVLNIFGWNHDALAPGKAFHAADVIEAFNLLIDAANRLDLTMLVDGARYGDILPDRQPGKSGKQGVNFRGTGAIAVDSAIGLLEADAGGQREGLILGKLGAQVARDDLHALVVEAPAEVGFTFDVDQAGLAQGRGGGDPHGFAEGVAADFEDAQAVYLAHARTFGVNEQCAFFDHFPNFGFRKVMALDARLTRPANVGIAYQRGAFLASHVGRFAGQIGKFRETRGHLVAASGLAHSIFHHGGHRGSVKRANAFLFGELPQASAVLAHDGVAHHHFLVKLNAHFENLAEIFFELIQQLVHVAVANENNLYINVDGFGL